MQGQPPSSSTSSRRPGSVIPVVSPLIRYALRFTAPHPTIRDLETQLQGRVLAGVSLIGFFCFAIGVLIFTEVTPVPQMIHISIWAMLSFVVTYLLSRTRHMSLAKLWLTLNFLLVSLYVITIFPDTLAMNTMFILVVLTMYSPRVGLSFAILDITLASMIARIQGDLPTDIISWDFFLILVMCSVAVQRLTTLYYARKQRNAEAQLRESETRYRQMFEHNNSIKLLIDPAEGQIIDANHAAVNFYGYPRSQLLTMQIRQINLLPPDHLRAAIDMAVTASKSPFVFQHRLASGEIRDVEVYSGPVQVGDKTYLYSVIQDVTQRHRAERALRENELFLRSIINNAPFGSFSFQVERGRYILISSNPAAERIIGEAFTEKFGQALDTLFGEAFRDRLRDIFDHLPHTETAYQNEEIDLRNGMQPLTLDVHVFRTQPDRIAIFFLDLSARRQAEEALRQAEERFSTLFHSSFIPMVITTAAEPARYIEANDAFINLVGYQRDELIGQSLLERGIAILDDERAERQTTLATHGHLTASEARIRNRAGTILNILLSSQRISFGGEACDFELMLDITDLKRAEEQALALAVERERIRILTQFIQDTSHEFRTPLSVIQMTTYLVSKSPDPARQEAHLATISEQVGHVNRLVDDLLEMSRLDGIQDLPLVRTNLGTLLRGLCENQEQVAIRRNIQFTTTITGSLMVEASPEDLTNGLSNLIANAIRYTPDDGQVSVIARQEDHCVIIEIRDSGMGIKAEHLPMLFTRFFRADSARTSRGSGLGLSIAQRVIELHHGHISVQSQVGAGSTFRIELPASRP